MNDPLADRLRDDGIVIVDGGLATQLEAHGHDLNDPLWSARLLLDDPAPIGQVHTAYLRAGADVATAATYQASLPGLRDRGLDDARAAAVLRSAVALARTACTEHANARGQHRPPLCVASLGAYGAYLADGSEYRGDYTIDDATLRRFHRERLRIVGPIADLVAFETIPCRREVEAIAEVLSEHPFPAWVSLCGRDDRHSGAGEPIEQCIAALAHVPSVLAIGINCTSPLDAEGLLVRLRHATARPLIAYPNAGERYLNGRWCGSALTPEDFVRHAQRWHAAGARIIGRCCRTTPAHIQALHRWRVDRSPRYDHE